MCFRVFLPLSTYFDVTSTIGVSIVRFLAFCDLKNQELEAFSENMAEFSFLGEQENKMKYFLRMETKTKILKMIFVYKLNLHKYCSQLIPLGKLKNIL